MKTNIYSDCEGEKVNNGTCDDLCCEFSNQIEYSHSKNYYLIFSFFCIKNLSAPTSKNCAKESWYSKCFSDQFNSIYLDNLHYSVIRSDCGRRLDRLGKLEHM